MSAWGAEPGTHGRPNRADRATVNRGPKAPSPNKVVSLLSLDLKPPPSLRNLGHKYGESGEVEGDSRWQNEDEGAGASEAYEGGPGPQSPGEEFPQAGHQEPPTGDASASSRGLWPASSSTAQRASRGRGAPSRSRGGSRGTGTGTGSGPDPYSSRNTGALLLDRTGTIAGAASSRRAPRSTLGTGSSGVVGALGLESGLAWQRRGGSRSSGRQGTRPGVRARNPRPARAARGATDKAATDSSAQDSLNKNEQPAARITITHLTHNEFIRTTLRV